MRQVRGRVVWYTIREFADDARVKVEKELREGDKR